MSNCQYINLKYIKYIDRPDLSVYNVTLHTSTLAGSGLNHSTNQIQKQIDTIRFWFDHEFFYT